MCASTSGAGDKPVYTPAAVEMGLAWMWLKALVKGLHLVKAPGERFPGRLAALWTVLNFARQPGIFSLRNVKCEKNCEVTFKNTTLKKVTAHLSYRGGKAKRWPRGCSCTASSDAGTWSETLTYVQGVWKISYVSE